MRIATVILLQDAIDRLMHVMQNDHITVDRETQTVPTVFQDRFALQMTHSVATAWCKAMAKSASRAMAGMSGL